MWLNRNMTERWVGGRARGWTLPSVKEGEEPKTVSTCHHPELSSASEPLLEKHPLSSSPRTHPAACHNISLHIAVGHRRVVLFIWIRVLRSASHAIHTLNPTSPDSFFTLHLLYHVVLLLHSIYFVFCIFLLSHFNRACVCCQTCTSLFRQQKTHWKQTPTLSGCRNRDLIHRGKFREPAL